MHRPRANSRPVRWGCWVTCERRRETSHKIRAGEARSSRSHGLLTHQTKTFKKHTTSFCEAGGGSGIWCFKNRFLIKHTRFKMIDTRMTASPCTSSEADGGAAFIRSVNAHIGKSGPGLVIGWDCGVGSAHGEVQEGVGRARMSCNCENNHTNGRRWSTIKGKNLCSKLRCELVRVNCSALEGIWLHSAFYICEWVFFFNLHTVALPPHFGWLASSPRLLCEVAHTASLQRTTCHWVQTAFLFFFSSESPISTAVMLTYVVCLMLQGLHRYAGFCFQHVLSA